MASVPEEMLHSIRENPDLQEAFRQEILTEELLNLPAHFSAFHQQYTEDRTRIDQRIDQLEERMEQRFLEVHHRIDRFEQEVHRQTNQTNTRIDQLEERVEQGFAEVYQRIDQTNARIDQLEERVEQGFAEVHQRIDQTNVRIDQLEERVEQGFAEVYQRIDQTNTRIDQLDARVEQGFSEVHDRIDHLRMEVYEISRAQSERIDRVEAKLQRMENDLGFLKGSDRERYYRDNAPSVFGRYLTGIYIPPRDKLVDDAQVVRPLSDEELDELLFTDLIVCGKRRKDRNLLYVVLEISWVIDRNDVERASRRAQILAERGYAVAPAVAGNGVLPDALEEAQAQEVAVLLEGRTIHPARLGE